MLLFLNPAQTRSTSNAASQIFITMGSVEFLPPLAAMRIDIVEDARTDPPPPPCPPPKGKTDGFSVKLPSTLDTRHSTSTAWPLPGRHPRTSTTVLFARTCARPRISPPPAADKPSPALPPTRRRRRRLSKPSPTQRLHDVGLNTHTRQPAASQPASQQRVWQATAAACTRHQTALKLL